mmetsp:Transcript_37192/g.78932  ORF Transcript_37192/g.78932 Transcript_37192/m.78932 type:complete len:362 (+) Transcript_37192:328-1413(+)|eukprot:CAMPEP_0206586476 /NCGR_PEP_ID=MMETSP0325_2-20121206/37044_1 /ASSEMBLY_ACC=CAM_ASM_000347 /TAXON_ID=2866 /ORGANISM="Crypthecodinium cohnii, Strain Seligo" /LENGTH=361 /DNA_ID=CAMNT_0054094239 /DNA_START=308 /DNA_END=1393 /DNA_ORIENTATION=+
MIDIMMRLMGVPIPSGGGLLAGLVACCAIYGIYKLSQCRLRHCPCFRWCLRVSGSDSFSDFELMIFVHEITFTACDQRMPTKVRATAGDQEVCTDVSRNKQFHQPLLLLVEQGSESLLLEVMDAKRGRPVAKLDLDVVELLKNKQLGQKRNFAMKELSKQVCDMRLCLTFQDNSKSDEEQGLLVNTMLNDNDDSMDDETKMMMKAHLQSAQQELQEEEDEASHLPPEVQKMRIIAKGCCGKIELVGGWGGKTEQYMAVQGPPEFKKFKLAIWASEQDYEKDQAPVKEIQLLRVRGVAPHPQSDQAFVVSHFLSPERKEDLLLYSLDRNRQVWVESLSLLVKMMHEMRNDDKKGSSKKSRRG